ncbi:thioesterase II family protein [Catellatospora bangladeshensis]|uniref:Thioesterase n=1 Tax=Catellatospora bangladeshensis TaxID=310355 RepID=A0A8J3JRP0_9ACTN|nr:alpha/beta fold hydrolase [Catellatospora bangladeshensis]GIF83688.1 thioesterase [Catellatospora bangladeshensis]
MTTSDDLGRLLAAAQQPTQDRGALRVQVFCLPHAGGGAMHFQSWQGWLPHASEVIPIDLPGHGRRFRERLVEDWQCLIDDLTGQIVDRITGPYIVVGHSLGSLLAYEVARNLQNRRNSPALLVVAGRNGPAAALSHRPIHELPDSQLLAALNRLGGTPADVDEHPELLEMYLPMLRTDLRLAETYRREPGPPLSCPIAVFGGRQDPMADSLGMLAWERETTESFDMTIFEGGHFFLTARAFTAALAARLDRLVEELAAV